MRRMLNFKDPFRLLIAMQSHIWFDKEWSLDVRIISCQVLWDLAIKVHYDHY